MASIIAASEVYFHQSLDTSRTVHAQSCSLALNISGMPSSSMNTLFDRSAFGVTAVSAPLAASKGTGDKPGAAAGGDLAREAAVKCSAVFPVSLFPDFRTHPCRMSKLSIVRRGISCTPDDIRYRT